MIDVIRNKHWFLGISFGLLVLSLLSIFTFGFREGIDLKGGTNWQVSISEETANPLSVREALLKTPNASEVNVREVGGDVFMIRLHEVSEDTHQAMLATLKERFPSTKEDHFSSIGPVIGAELKRKAIFAIVTALLGISLYIAWAFRKVSEPVRSSRYGIVTLITLFHDVAIPAGLMALLGHIKGVEIDTNFIVALLVVMGFSVHDTIVVFDRIRENLLRSKNQGLGEIINTSIKETIARSINTSLTLIIVLIALLFAGPASLFYFVLIMLVGTVFGTYSSIFLASPLLYLFQKRRG